MKQFGQDETAIAPTVDGLRRECHLLIERISHHRNNLKLLLVCREQLKMSANYKAGRKVRSAHKAFDE